MLTGSLVVLRQPLPGDIDLLIRLRNDVRLQAALMSIARPSTPRRVEAWLGKRLDDEQGVFFIIAVEETGQACGFIQLVNINFIAGTGTLGICLDESVHGKGHAGDAMRLLEEYAKDAFNLRKITLEVLASNLRAINFYKKLGYTGVGVRREHFYHSGTYHDVALMEKFIRTAEAQP